MARAERDRIAKRNALVRKFWGRSAWRFVGNASIHFMDSFRAAPMTINYGNFSPYDHSQISRMGLFDKLPKCVRQALANADHNWSGAQINRAYKRKLRHAARSICVKRCRPQSVPLGIPDPKMRGENARGR
jgi:Family of unknown function (DUF6525)